MENTDEVLLQCAGQAESVEVDAAVGLDQEPELEQRDASEPDAQPESNQEPPATMNGPSSQAPIEFRIQQLQNRQFLLLEMRHFREKAKDNRGSTTEEMSSVTCEDSDGLCELEAIRKELAELLVKKEELDKHGTSFTLSQQDAHPTFYKPETPHGGIYMLPPPQLNLQDELRRNTIFGAERPAGPVVAVESLGQTPAVTQCPSCRDVIFTETHRRAGETVWILCCLCSLTGCVAGCCLIPFFMDRLKDIHHQCPRCQANVHTYRPF